MPSHDAATSKCCGRNDIWFWTTLSFLNFCSKYKHLNFLQGLGGITTSQLYSWSGIYHEEFSWYLLRCVTRGRSNWTVSTSKRFDEWKAKLKTTASRRTHKHHCWCTLSSLRSSLSSSNAWRLFPRLDSRETLMALVILSCHPPHHGRYGVLKRRTVRWVLAKS